MSNAYNILGERGEAEIHIALVNSIDVTAHPGYPRYLFKPHFLGEKAELFDYLVYLLDFDQRPTGAHFFLQVKATEIPSTPISCVAPFSSAEVKRSALFKMPFYVAAADLSPGNRAIYVRGMSHNKTKGISTIKKRSDFGLDRVKIMIYDEVEKFHARKRGVFVSSVE